MIHLNRMLCRKYYHFTQCFLLEERQIAEYMTNAYYSSMLIDFLILYSQKTSYTYMLFKSSLLLLGFVEKIDTSPVSRCQSSVSLLIILIFLEPYD